MNSNPSSNQTALSDDAIRGLANRFHTPLYVFQESEIRRQCRALKNAVTYPHTTFRYAAKALTLECVLKIVKDEGFGLDASSLNEVLRGINSCYKASEIFYTGEGASEAAFKEMVHLGVQMNCSSLDQIELLGKIAPGSKVSVRFNPGEGHGAFKKINTGGPHSKHGIYFDQIENVKALAKKYKLQINGIHTHIGSGTDIVHWLRIKDITLSIAKQFQDLSFVDLGGGFPIVYNSETDTPMDLKTWGNRISEAMESFSKEYGKEIHLDLEPGRFVVAECGSLLAEVQAFKTTPEHEFVIVNTGFNHNPRPAMYGAYHPIRFVPASPGTQKDTTKKKYAIAGNLCESGDVFTVNDDSEIRDREFPPISRGDIMVMGLIGAYSHPMKSDYNSMNLPASVLICSDNTVKVVERRGTIDDVTRREREAFNPETLPSLDSLLGG